MPLFCLFPLSNLQGGTGYADDCLGDTPKRLQGDVPCLLAKEVSQRKLDTLTHTRIKNMAHGLHQRELATCTGDRSSVLGDARRA